MLKEFLDSNLIATLIGLFSAIVGFYISEAYRSLASGVDEAKKFSTTLEILDDEYSSCVHKLSVLRDSLKGIYTSIHERGDKLVFPSFELRPESLFSCKERIADFSRNAEIVRDVGAAYFELCHIQKKVDFLGSYLASGAGSKGMDSCEFALENIRRSLILIESAILSFSKFRESLDPEIKKLSLYINEKSSLLLTRE